MPRYTAEAAVGLLLILWTIGAFVTPFGGSRIHFILPVAAAISFTRLCYAFPLQKPIP